MVSKDLQTKLESVPCPVCRTAIFGTVRCCSICETVHHRDCWDYSGGCAIYGCLSLQDESANGSAGSAPPRPGPPPPWLDPFNVMVVLIMASAVLQCLVPRESNRSGHEEPTPPRMASAHEVPIHQARARLGQPVLDASRGETIILQGAEDVAIQLVPLEPQRADQPESKARPTR